MSLLEKLRKQRMQAMKDRNAIEKDILSVALGDCELAESRQGQGPIEDTQVENIIRKIIAGNNEVLSFRDNEKLVKENQILEEFLPKQMTIQEIEAFFLNGNGPHFEMVRDAVNDGQATGIAVKALREAGLTVDGKLVKEVVATIRDDRG